MADVGHINHSFSVAFLSRFCPVRRERVTVVGVVLDLRDHSVIPVILIGRIVLDLLLSALYSVADVQWLQLEFGDGGVLVVYATMHMYFQVRMHLRYYACPHSVLKFAVDPFAMLPYLKHHLAHARQEGFSRACRLLLFHAFWFFCSDH